MTINSISPGYMVVFYTINNFEHRHTVPLRLSGAENSGDATTVELNDATDVNWKDFVDDYLAVYKAFFHTSTSFSRVELWSVSAPGADPLFQATYAPAGVVGTNATAVFPAGQAVITFRTNQGGLWRSYTMEMSATVVNTIQPAPFAAGATKNYSDFVIGQNSAVIGRDGGQLVGPTRRINKTNDALRRKRLALE